MELVYPSLGSRSLGTTWSGFSSFSPTMHQSRCLYLRAQNLRADGTTCDVGKFGGEPTMSGPLALV
jgi:hypothetical protein